MHGQEAILNLVGRQKNLLKNTVFEKLLEWGEERIVLVLRTQNTKYRDSETESPSNYLECVPNCLGTLAFNTSVKTV